MAFFQWRRFNFFDLSKDVGGQLSEVLKEKKITATTSGHGYIVLGDADGELHFINRHFVVSSFVAYKIEVLHAQQLRQTSLLVTIGKDEPGINPLIKVWNLDKPDKNGLPMCVWISRAIPGNKPSPATALVVHENVNYMAVGFAEGSVVLYRGDFTRNRSCKQKIIHDGDSPVIGLAFKTSAKATHLFVATTDNVYSYNITVKDKPQKLHLDALKSPAQCSVFADSPHEGHFMIGRNDAVYCYTPDGRGPCYAFDGEKMFLHWFRGYLIIVARDTKTATRTTASGTDASSTTDGAIMDKYSVTVFDIQNKFIAFSSPMKEVMSILSEWGSLYILTGDKKIHQLSEKDTQTKLALLFKKNLYDIAIRIAKSQQYDADGLIDIFRQYGDHLYTKGDHNGAIEQYIKTIGKLETSYVIRKFLDAQRIHNLTAYLQGLHKQGLATEDHTTLLLNCYTKLKDDQKLDEFIMTKDRDVDFDVEIAIKVCRQAGYFKHALSLARKHAQHIWYLKIQIEDHKDFKEALDYISKLEFEEAEENMKKYGSILLENAPVETTELLKRLCTDYRPSNKPLVDQDALDGYSTPQIQKASPEEFIHIFVNNSKQLVEFLEHMIKVQPASSTLVYNTLMEHYLHEYSSLVDPQEKLGHEQRIMRMLQNPEANCDIDQALVLCQLHDFRTGILFLYEKTKLYQQILCYHMKHQDYQAVINICKKFGQQDPDLWVQALWYLSQEPDAPTSYLSEVLTVNEKKKLMSPLLVIDTLSRSPSATLGLVKDYLIRMLQTENSQIAEDERLIKQYREETEKIRNQIHDIKTRATIFQGSKCSACNHPLELPTVHFLCQHSYHQHCFESYAENDNECPACLPENKKILDIIRAQEQNRDLHEQFHSQLERADDGFSIVAEYFGRGVFNKVTLITDLPADGKPVNRERPTTLSMGLPDQFSKLNVGKGAEARMRLTEGHGPGKPRPTTSVTEGRLRAGKGFGTSAAPVEERRKLGGGGKVAASHGNVQPSQSSRSSGWAPQKIEMGLSSSLEANLNQPGDTKAAISSRLTRETRSISPLRMHPRNVSSGQPASRSRNGETMKPKTAVGANPFENDYDESKNPFADSASKNPFEEDDYDKNLNPFLE